MTRECPFCVHDRVDIDVRSERYSTYVCINSRCPKYGKAFSTPREEWKGRVTTKEKVSE